MGTRSAKSADRRSRSNGPAAKLRVGFLLMPKFTMSAFSAFVDVLRLAGDEGDRSRPIECSWHIMSPGREQARASCGISLQPTSGLIEPKELDYIVVIGGLLENVTVDDKVATYLRRAASHGATLVGICTGSFVLCRLGLMEGRKCCVSWYHVNDFADEFPTLTPVADRLFVIDRDRITCAGGIAAADLAARLVSEHLGPSRSQKALHILLLDRARSEVSAQPAPPLSVNGGDDRIGRVLLLMEQNLAAPLRISAIAKAVGMSARSLERLCRESLNKSPQQIYLSIRLMHAKWMLEKTDLSSSLIGMEFGFVDGSHFSRCFKAEYNTTPSEYRRSLMSRDSTGVSQRHQHAPRMLMNPDRRIFD